MKIKTKTLRLTSLIVSNVTTVLFGVATVATSIAMANAGAISNFLNQPTQEIINVGNNKQNTLYYDSDFVSIKDLKAAGKRAMTEVSQEGSVLLKNENNALPLTRGAKVNLYSSNSVNYIYSGGGSSFNKKSEFESLKDGLIRAKFDVNTNLWDWYSNNPQYFDGHTSNTSSDGANYSLNDCNWNQIDTPSKNDPCDAAIFVLSRYGTEATDHKNSQGPESYRHGNYLELTNNEIDVLTNLSKLKNEHKIGKIIVLLNSVNQVQCDFLFNDTLGIDAALWVGEGGSYTTYGIGQVLNGEVSPSGKLSDTFWKYHYLNPVYANFGSYDNKGVTISTSNSGKSNRYVVYQEGIYNGYRYTETRYEDSVLNTSHVGTFDYNQAVAYPFGFGLSYSEFEYSNLKVSQDKAKDEYIVNIDVKNVGTCKGKEAVQLFLQQPYTEYDITNHLEKPAVELVAFNKTKLLAPNQSETLTLKVDGRWFAAYDAYKAKTYILDEGDYYLTIASDAHEATNNILAAKKKKGINVDATKMNNPGDASLVWETNKKFSDTKYANSKVTNKPITNQFDNADLNLYKNKGSNSVTYISRNNWEGTTKLGLSDNYERLNNHVVINTSEEMKQDAKKLADTITKDDIAYPTYGKDNKMNLAGLLTIVDGKVEQTKYDDARWDKLLDQLTWEDTVTLLSNGLRKTSVLSSIGKPETIDGNGALSPVGGTTFSYDGYDGVATNRFAFMYDDPDKSSSPLQYPCAELLASTRNVELLEEIGELIGEECLWCGYSGLYGFGVNLHRGTYSGRAFEYYSEDGILSGYCAAAQVKGIRSNGVYVYMKHAILNEQEKNREGVNTWANEQTIRQLYLRPFQIAIEDGGAENVMTGFNRIGLVWTSQQGFINTVLRDEFDMKGFAVSDFWQDGYMNLVGGIMGGSALPDGDTAQTAEKSQLNRYKQGYGALANAMREEVHHILYVVVNSNAMNGVSSNTIFKTITPQWVKSLNAANIVIDVIFAISLASLVSVAGYEIFIKIKSNKNKVEK